MKYLKTKYVPKIIITGGPGGGKSEFLKKELRIDLIKKGFTPFFISEAATLVNSFGLDLGSKYAQKAILRTIITLVQSVTDYALESEAVNPIIICDRGELDALAYCDVEYFEEICAELGTSINELRRSYTAVIHFTTAADGKEKIYNRIRKDNPARSEDAIGARNLDKKFKDIHTGVKQLHIVNNKTNFKRKIEIGVSKLMHSLGYPKSLEIERKFLIDLTYTPEQIAAHFFKTDITQDYIQTRAGNTSRVRKEIFDTIIAYTTTTKTQAQGYAKDEDEESIIQSVYSDLLQNKDPGKSTIYKERYRFLYLDQYFELDFFFDESLGKYLVMLEIELTKKYQRVLLPPWLPVIKEVTHLKPYQNSNIAKSLATGTLKLY